MTDSYQQENINLFNKGAGEFSKCFNVVSSIDDLPPPVGGVRTLPSGIGTLICGQITLPAGESILVPNDSVLLGRDPDFDGIIGDVDAPMIDTEGNGLVVKDIFFANINSGPSAYCARATSLPAPDNRVSRFETVSVIGNRGILIEDVFFVSMDTILSRCENEGISFAGNCEAVTITKFTQANPTSPTSRGIVFLPGSTSSAIEVVGSQFGLQQTSQVAVDLEPGASLNLAGFFSNAFLGILAAPPATPLSGLSPDGQVDVIFMGNFGVSDSKNGGTTSISENPASITTVVGAPGAWVRVGAGNPGTHPLFVLDAGSARVLLDQPAGAESARLVYAGIEPASAQVFASLSVGPSALIGAISIGARLVYLPAGGGSAPIDPSIFTVSAGLLLSGNSISLTGSQVMNPGDAIAIEIQNATSGAALVVDSVNIGFNGS
jgi:hypothetical protein